MSRFESVKRGYVTSTRSDKGQNQINRSIQLSNEKPLVWLGGGLDVRVPTGSKTARKKFKVYRTLTILNVLEIIYLVTLILSCSISILSSILDSVTLKT